MTKTRSFGHPVREPRPSPSQGNPQVRGYVLAGGASSRFGRDKALVPLAGKPCLARMLELLGQSGVRETLVIGKKSLYGHLGSPCVADKWPGEGPLGGIITALRCSGPNKYGYLWNLIVSCDMPFLTAKWLEHILKTAFKSEADVVLAKSEHGPEPLCAVWRTSCCDAVEAQFQRGVRRVNEAIGHLKSEVLDAEDWKRFDSAGRLFWNMNTFADYEEAQRILEAEQKQT